MSSIGLKVLMALSGLVLWGYLIVHFTTGNACCARRTMEKLVSETGDAHIRPNAYLMVYSAFKNPVVVAIYVVGQILLFSHLLHGSVSLFQSIGGYRLFRASL